MEEYRRATKRDVFLALNRKDLDLHPLCVPGEHQIQRDQTLHSGPDSAGQVEGVSRAQAGCRVHGQGRCLAELNNESPPAAIPAAWAPDAEKELRKIPFFVRGKARRNTERYAQDHRVPVITIETLYDAKAHFSR